MADIGYWDEDTRYWSWSRTSTDGRWRLTSISVYEDKIYESWERIETCKQIKADSTKNRQHKGAKMPRGWIKHAKELYKCAMRAKKKMVNKQQAGRLPKST
jgi:hypothetical protein